MKKIRLSSLLIIITVIVILLNFNNTLQGSNATFINLFATISYLLVWLFVFRYSIRYKEFNLIVSSIVFWSIVFVTSLAAIYINISDATINFIIPFVIVFLTPLYGFGILGIRYIIMLTLFLILSIYFIYFGLKSIIKGKKV